MVKMGNVIAVWLLDVLGQQQKSLLQISIEIRPNYLYIHANEVWNLSPLLNTVNKGYPS